MKYRLIGAILGFLGVIFFLFATYSIIETILNYNMILPSSVNAFIDFYIGKPFEGLSDLAFLGVFGAVGLIFFYFGIYMIYLFRQKT